MVRESTRAAGTARFWRRRRTTAFFRRGVLASAPPSRPSAPRTSPSRSRSRSSPPSPRELVRELPRALGGRAFALSALTSASRDAARAPSAPLRGSARLRRRLHGGRGRRRRRRRGPRERRPPALGYTKRGRRRAQRRRLARLRPTRARRGDGGAPECDRVRLRVALRGRVVLVQDHRGRRAAAADDGGGGGAAGAKCLSAAALPRYGRSACAGARRPNSTTAAFPFAFSSASAIPSNAPVTALVSSRLVGLCAPSAAAPASRWPSAAARSAALGALSSEESECVLCSGGELHLRAPFPPREQGGELLNGGFPRLLQHARGGEVATLLTIMPPRRSIATKRPSASLRRR